MVLGQLQYVAVVVIAGRIIPAWEISLMADMAGIKELREQFENVGRIVDPQKLLIIMGEVYGRQGKHEVKRLFWNLASTIAALEAAPATQAKT
jgi:hypothetical protein